MRYFVSLFMVFATAFTGILLAGYLQPRIINEMLTTIDFMGVTEEARLEHARRDAIDAFTISNNRKEILINRQIFIGATQQMVVLALGEPLRKGNQPESESTPAYEVWLYHLKGDSRPTILTFEQEALIGAEKASAADIE